jgi:hypothetical protein
MRTAKYQEQYFWYQRSRRKQVNKHQKHKAKIKEHESWQPNRKIVHRNEI